MKTDLNPLDDLLDVLEPWQAKNYVQERIRGRALKASDTRALAEQLGMPSNAFDAGPEERRADTLGNAGNEQPAPVDQLLESEQPNTDHADNTQINKPKFEFGGVSIPAGSTKDFTVGVSPLSLDSEITIAPVAPLSKTWAGIVWKSWVSGINELTVRLANVTDKAIKPALQEFFQVQGVGVQSSPTKVPDGTEEANEELKAARVVGNHFSVGDRRTHRTFGKAAAPVDGEALSDSMGF